MDLSEGSTTNIIETLDSLLTLGRFVSSNRCGALREVTNGKRKKKKINVNLPPSSKYKLLERCFSPSPT